VAHKVTVRTFFERILAEMDRRYQQRFESSETALQEAKASIEKRLDGMNEFRGALSDATGKFITRSEALAMVLAACTITGTIVAVVSFFMHR
jgi:hypothetical protein